MKKTEIKNKILDLDKVEEKIKKLKKLKKKVVHCHGVFDLLHIGVRLWPRGGGGTQILFDTGVRLGL